MLTSHYISAGVGVGSLRRYLVHPPRLELESDGERIPGVSAFFQNGSPYTYFKTRPIDLVEGARLDSGALAGVILTRARPWDVPTVTFRALSGAAPIAKHRGVRAFKCATRAVVRSLEHRPHPMQVDGAHVGDETEVELAVGAGVLRVVS